METGMETKKQEELNKKAQELFRSIPDCIDLAQVLDSADTMDCVDFGYIDTIVSAMFRYAVLPPEAKVQLCGSCGVSLSLAKYCNECEYDE